MKFIDCHNHLLPCVDDGAKSLEEALESLRLLRSQGVTSAVLTPHVNSAFASRPGVTKADLRRKYIALKEACEKEPSEYPNISIGSEYYFDPELEDTIDPLPMAGSDVVMLELPYGIDLAGVIRSVEIARSEGYRVLLAHPEKYDAFKYQWDEALRFLQTSPDVFVQLETWDIGKHNEYSWQFIESRTATVVGTDSHGYHRKPAFDRAITALTEWAQEDKSRQRYAEGLLGKNAQKLFGLSAEMKYGGVNMFEIENGIYNKFKEAAEQNGESASAILSDFMKDYIVSYGHPEQVQNKWPWNRNSEKEEK